MVKEMVSPASVMLIMFSPPGSPLARNEEGLVLSVIDVLPEPAEKNA